MFTDRFFADLKLLSELKTWYSRYSTYGKCFEVQPPRRLESVVLMQIETKIDAYVFLAAQDNFFNDDTHTKAGLCIFHIFQCYI